MEIPRALLDEYTLQLNTLSEAAQKLILNALRNAEWSSVTELREIMCAVMDQVCMTVADDAAVIASDMYDDIREASVGKRLGALPPSGYDGAATNGAVRALVESVVQTGGTTMFGRQLAARVDYEIKKAAGETVMRQAARDPLKPRWARVPAGYETCTFCLMLASRGFVYHSDASAGAGGHYHPHCDCRIVPGFDGMEVQGYDPNSLYARYRDCENALDGDWLHSRYQMLPESERARTSFDEYRTKKVLAEMRTRDPIWLNKGIAPKITFETPGIEREIRSKRPGEIRTAERLSLHGIKCRFVVDTEQYYDEAKKILQTRGLADLEHGIELKTLVNTASFNTIDKHIGDAGKKANAKTLVIDNTDNAALDDGALADMVRKSRRFRNGKIYILSEETFLRIR